MSFFREIDDEKWIREQLLHIEKEETREQCKQIMDTCMKPLAQEYKRTLHQIEEQLLRDEQKSGNYQVITAIASREEYDFTDELLFPMIGNDMDEVLIDTKQLMQNLADGKPTTLYQVYFTGEYLHLLEIMDRGILFPATAFTDYGVYKGMVSLEENHRYDELLSELYRFFVINGISWSPVHTCFLKRIFNLQLVQLEAPEVGEQINRIEIEFQGYQDSFLLHPVPLWNVRKKVIFSAAYPVESPNGLMYEHIIPESKLTSQGDYLVEGNCQVFGLHRSKEGDLLIRSDSQRPVEWTLLELQQWDKKKKIPFPYRISSKHIPTRAFRTVGEAIYYTNQIELEGIRLMQVSTTRPAGFREEVVYDMNFFLEDQLMTTREAPQLFFQWECVDKKNPWKQDILSYYYTCLKQVYPEYQIMSEFQ